LTVFSFVSFVSLPLFYPARAAFTSSFFALSFLGCSFFTSLLLSSLAAAFTGLAGDLGGVDFSTFFSVFAGSYLLFSYFTGFFSSFFTSFFTSSFLCSTFFSSFFGSAFFSIFLGSAFTGAAAS
jgi:hypothetical protein